MHNNRRPAVPLEALDPTLTDVSRRVIGFAIEVHKTLGPGFTKEVYGAALAHELKTAEIPHKQNAKVSVMYHDVSVGELTLDLIVNERFAVTIMDEPREIDGLDRTTLRAQLRAADLELGLIINFGERRLKDGLVRVLNPDKLNAVRGDQHEDDDEYEDDDEDE
ncbi:MAG: GxxExxY protein [Phycisphaeraceae bacterium]|nr:GxxExxY protein [Phycisphaeraceae bacterium]